MVGFRDGRSSIDSVVGLIASVQELRTENHITAGMLLDIKGAYDNAEHAAIFRGLGQSSRIYTGIVNFLTDITTNISTQKRDVLHTSFIAESPKQLF